MRAAVLIQAADIAPVTRRLVAVERLSLFEQPRKDVAAPVIHLVRFHVVQDSRLQHVDAGVDRIREDLAPLRLFQEATDPAGVVGNDHPILERAFDPGEAESRHRAALAVGGDEGGEIDVGERIPAEDQKAVVVQEVLGFLHTAGRPQRRVLDCVTEVHAELAAVAKILLDIVGQIVQRDDDLADPVAQEQFEDVLHHGFVHDRDERLGAVKRQGAEAAALASRHDDCFHRKALLGPGQETRRPSLGKELAPRLTNRFLVRIARRPGRCIARFQTIFSPSTDSPTCTR